MGKGSAAFQGATILLGLVKDAARLSPIPLLSPAAELTLRLFTIAESVRDNKKGFQQLSVDATQFVTVLWRSYQGAVDKDKWLENNALRASLRELNRTLGSIIKLGEQMNSRNIALRLIYYLLDAKEIKGQRDKLTVAVDQFQLATSLDMHAMLVCILDTLESPNPVLTSQIDTNTDRYRDALETENRAQVFTNITNAAIATGRGDATLENHGGKTPHRRPPARPQPGPNLQSPNANGRSPANGGMVFQDISNAAISTGEGSARVTNHHNK